MKFELDEYNRNITEIQLIEDLVAVAKKLNTQIKTTSKTECCCSESRLKR